MAKKPDISYFKGFIAFAYLFGLSQINFQHVFLNYRTLGCFSGIAIYKAQKILTVVVMLTKNQNQRYSDTRACLNIVV